MAKQKKKQQKPKKSAKRTKNVQRNAEAVALSGKMMSAATNAFQQGADVQAAVDSVMDAHTAPPPGRKDKDPLRVSPQPPMMPEKPAVPAASSIESTSLTQRRYDIVSTIAYLIGIDSTKFNKREEGFSLQRFDELAQIKEARIIRNLSIIRMALLANYRIAKERLVFYKEGLRDLSSLLSPITIEQLAKDGVEIEKPNFSPDKYIFFLSGLIAEHIDRCEFLFQPWLKWEYVRALFITPELRASGDVWDFQNSYYAQKDLYPYQTYLHWDFEGRSGEGNILFNDPKFIDLLYQQHGDKFTDRAKITNPDVSAKDKIYQFLEESNKAVLVVDCENADPYKLYATLNNLNEKSLLAKVNKVILYNDIHASSAWKIMEQFVSLKVEYKEIDRIKMEKSLVDTSLSVGVCREFYENAVDSFILVSSDSDYWGLINSLPDAKYLVLMEQDKSCSSIRQALRKAKINYCFTDDFYTGNSYEIKVHAVLAEMQASIDRACQINVRDLFQSACRSSMANLTPTETEQIFHRYVLPMKPFVDDVGDLHIKLIGAQALQSDN